MSKVGQARSLSLEEADLGEKTEKWSVGSNNFWDGKGEMVGYDWIIFVFVDN